MPLILKDPDARLDYAFDWAETFAPHQMIAASAWQVVPDAAGGVVVLASGHDLLVARATLAGGQPGHVYRVANRVTASDGQIDERSLTVRVEQR